MLFALVCSPTKSVSILSSYDTLTARNCILTPNINVATTPISTPLYNRELLMLLKVVLVADSSGSMVSGFLVAPRVPTSWCCGGCSGTKGEGGCGRLPGSPSVSKGWVGERGAERRNQNTTLLSWIYLHTPSYLHTTNIMTPPPYLLKSDASHFLSDYSYIVVLVPVVPYNFTCFRESTKRKVL